VPIGPTTIVRGKIYGSGWRDDATGALLPEEAVAFEEEDLDEFGWPRGYTMIWYLVKSDRFGEFVLRESALFGGMAGLSLMGAGLVVVRRRPG
jgi:hypothetical protein